MPVHIWGEHREGAAWPEFAGSELLAAAGVRASGVSTLLVTNEGAEALEGLYGSRQAQRVHARDQMVTGASPATSPCGGASRLR